MTGRQRRVRIVAALMGALGIVQVAWGLQQSDLAYAALGGLFVVLAALFLLTEG